jgi:hypothetical protein
MKTAGGIIAVIAGIYGEIVSVLSMILESGDTIVTQVGSAGILSNFVAIVLGALAAGGRSRGAGVLLIITSLLGIAWVAGWQLFVASRGTMSGGDYVGISMVVSLLGGVMVAASDQVD